MQKFRDLQVWQKAHALTLAVYEATQSFPREEMFGLTSQMRRAAASIPTNLAEGCGRDGVREMSRFCQIAFGSASEVEYQLLLSRDLGYLDEQRYRCLASDVVTVKRMLGALLRTLRSREHDQPATIGSLNTDN